MKIKLILILLGLFLTGTANAELSFTNEWRIDQAKNRCEQANDELIYKDYWGDTVKPENLNPVCMAEYFTELITAEGDEWLEKKATVLIDQCKEEGKKDERKYLSCIQSNIEQVTRILSSPCVELQKEGLWKEDRCRRLVSYIFINRFNDVLEANKSLYERIFSKVEYVKNNVVLRFLFHPITAVLYLILYVLHFVFIVDPGNWIKVTKSGAIVGSIIIAASFIDGGIRYLSSALAMVILIGLMIWNHMTMKKENNNSNFHATLS